MRISEVHTHRGSGGNRGLPGISRYPGIVTGHELCALDCLCLHLAIAASRLFRAHQGDV